VRLIAFFLCILTLVLSVVPCCPINAKEKQQQDLLTNSPKEKDNGCCGHCSPFYTCGCCPGCIIVKPFLFHMALIQPMAAVHSRSYQQPFIKEITLNIWQPPQLS
jgi:hypothetical protein